MLLVGSRKLLERLLGSFKKNSWGVPAGQVWGTTRRSWEPPGEAPRKLLKRAPDEVPRDTPSKIAGRQIRRMRFHFGSPIRNTVKELHCNLPGLRAPNLLSQARHNISTRAPMMFGADQQTTLLRSRRRSVDSVSPPAPSRGQILERASRNLRHAHRRCCSQPGRPRHWRCLMQRVENSIRASQESIPHQAYHPRTDLHQAGKKQSRPISPLHQAGEQMHPRSYLSNLELFASFHITYICFGNYDKHDFRNENHFFTFDRFL